MLQNRTISSSLSPAVSSEWDAPERRALFHEHYATVVQTLRLPDTLRSFLFFTLAIILICAGLTLHLQLSTTILQARIELERLQAQKVEIAQQAANLTWTIAQETDLQQLSLKATQIGYQPALNRDYIVASNEIPGQLLSEASGGELGGVVATAPRHATTQAHTTSN